MLGKIKKALFSQFSIVCVLLLAQIYVYVDLVSRISTKFVAFFYAVSVIAVVSIITSHMRPSYKLSWIIPIVIFPVFGGLFYAILKLQSPTHKAADRLEKVLMDSRPALKQSEDVYDDLKSQSEHFASSIKYMNNSAYYCAVKNTKVDYFPLGDDFFPVFLNELEKAEKFIFLEFFIIDEGLMWDRTLEVLKRKAAEGVEVRVIYDGVGCVSTLPRKYPETLKAFGIDCRVFNPFIPVFTVAQNNRDHRKIAVVDGRVAFNGGVNLADEYINHIHRFGHWRDSAVMLRGDAAYNFTVMFLQMWEFTTSQKVDYESCRPAPEVIPDAEGFVMPYADYPIDEENVGEFIYLDLINNATNYLYIATPYLMLDTSMLDALKYAVKRGVDVKIIIPSKPDKWYAYYATKSYAAELAELGAEIYVYSPGFIHNKQVVSDHDAAVVGSINFDYRSLYLHYECATWLYKCPAVRGVYDDFLSILTLCERVDSKTLRGRNVIKRFLSVVFRLFAPLM